MKKTIFIFTFVILTQTFSTGCSSLTLETSYAGKTVDTIDTPVLAGGSGNMWNVSEKGVGKKEAVSKAVLPPGADYIGEKKNYSVAYKVSYLDSLLTVLSLGLYAPFSVEYVRTQEYQQKLDRDRNGEE